MRNLLLGITFIFTALLGNAQNSSKHNELVQREMNAYQTFKQGQLSNNFTNGEDFDVKYYRLELRLNPDTSIGKYVKGAVTMYFKTLNPNFNKINLDFASALLCDSVIYKGVKLASGVVKQADTLRISIPAIASAGTLDSVKIYYKGVPPITPGFSNGTGFVKSTHGSPVKNYIYTLSEPYSAFTWWPCKSLNVSDKADSVDIIVSTPSAFTVAANGKRISEVTINPNTKITTWKHRYPISSYQVAVGVANYVQYPATPTLVNIGGTNMELYNLIFPEGNTAAAAIALDRTADMLTVFSNKFGDYPYKTEKYGNYSFGFGGGMEHNTFSGMNPSTYNATNDWDVIAHELGHQWFGAAVTCGSWRDIWLNESFARYSEVVYLEFKTPDPYITTTVPSYRSSIKSTATSSSYQAEPILQYDTSDIMTIFNPSVYVYERGAMFVSMLRKTLGDAKFFQALKNYQNDPLLKYGNATNADMQRHMQAMTSLDLSEMFNDWLTKRGYAQYAGALWNNSGTDLILKMPQTTYGNYNPHFDLPIVVRVRKTTAPTKDTTIVIFDKEGSLLLLKDGVVQINGSTTIQVPLSFIPDLVSFDDYYEVLATGTFTKSAALLPLATSIVDFSGKKVNKDVNLLLHINQANDYASFEVERSMDGINFNKIGNHLDPHGINEFTYTDPNVPLGILYYRIKIIDRNDSRSYTKTIVINSKSNSLYTVTPNPAKDFVLITSKEQNSSMVTLKILDTRGQLMMKQAKKAISFNNTLKVDVSTLANGIYYVEIENENNEKTIERIIVLR